MLTSESKLVVPYPRARYRGMLGTIQNGEDGPFNVCPDMAELIYGDIALVHFNI